MHGSLVRMSPIGPKHASQQPFLAAADSEPEPDVAVVPPGRYSDRHPDRAMLIVEVAESSLAYDRDTKAPLYAASGVEEYWIVDLSGRAVEVHRQPQGGRYATTTRVPAGETLSPAAFPDVVVTVGDLLP
jgi:Uma2 family endonuclease